MPDPSVDGQYNIVWWNASDYGDPADDPNREIVRVTARTADTLTVTRAQESTSASTKNTTSKTYRMVLGITKKTVTDISDHINSSNIREISSYNDTILSGTPKIVRFERGGQYYYTKAYPSVSSLSGATNDLDANDMYSLDDAYLSGTPKIVLIETNNTKHFAKVYPEISAAVHYSGTLNARPSSGSDKTLSGAPRIIEIPINGSSHYMKVYPNKN